MLLTLQAVPFFYSLFKDVKESRAWGYIGAGYNNFKGGAGRRLSEAYASATGIFSRKSKAHEPVVRQTVKDGYVDQASGD